MGRGVRHAGYSGGSAARGGNFRYRARGAGFGRLPALRLPPMCGIVGYVGSQSALDVVMAGLKRLEYRGYDSAGVAVPADGGSPPRRRPGNWSTWRRSWSNGRCRPGRRGSGTPGGPRMAGPRTRTPIRTWTTPAGSPSCTTGSSRTSRSSGPSWPSAGIIWPPRRTPRWSRICSPRSSRSARTWRRPCGWCAGASKARSRWWRCTPMSRTWSSARGGTRPSWWASERARPFSPRTSPRSSPTRGRRSSWVRTRWWSCAGTG